MSRSEGAAYPTLLSPLRIGAMEVRNRVLQTAHTKLFSVNGVDSARDLHYQVARARGGAGLLVTGNRLVDPASTAGDLGYPRAHLREAIEADRRVTEAVHRHGARIIAQLNHFGLQGTSDAADDLRVVLGPSAVKSPAYNEVGKPMDAEDIARNVTWWARAAAQARESGFDGVEISVVHSYLLHQFLSPIYNKRTDEYGGDLHGRMRLAREVLAAVRDAVGADYVVGVRLVLSDFMEGGLDIEDAMEVGRTLRADGVDYLNVSAGGYHNLYMSSGPTDMPDGWLTGHVAQLKEAVGDLPVFAVGGVKDPAQAERLLAAGHADMVAMTRAQIADPDLVEKVRTGREDEIRHCIRGNQGCISRFFRGLPIGCTVNPIAGRERHFADALKPAAEPRTWVVVGGGPAGMKAAETLAGRGHRVVLLEREDELGGQVRLILASPGRDEFGWLVRDLEGRLGALGVDVRLGTEADADAVLALEPDEVVVATGARPDRSGFSIVAAARPGIPGADLEHVRTGWHVLADPDDLPEGPVVVVDDDGTRYAAGVIERLLDAGRSVELITRFGSVLPGTLTTLEQPVLYARLFGKGLSYRVNAWVSAIEPGAVTAYELYTGATTTLPAAAVVLVTAAHADDALFGALRGRHPSVHRIGDCLSPRKLDHAIYEGFVLGAEMWDRRLIAEGELEAWDAPA